MPKNVTGRVLVDTCKSIICDTGKWRKFASDNGPQFASREFKEFAREYGFDHVTSSPHYPQSNGFIERMIQTVKRTLTKARESGQDEHMALLILKATPIDNVLPSPGEIMFNRRLLTKLPVRIPTDRRHDDIRERLCERQSIAKANHDQAGVRELPPLIPGQPVSVLGHSDHKWHPATIEKVGPEPRSYVIATPDGKSLRRNRSHLRERNVPTTSLLSKEGNGQEIPSVVTPTPPSPNVASPAKSVRFALPANDTASPPPLRRSSRPSKQPDRLIENI